MFGSTRLNYNGNANLKASGVKIQYTKDQLIELTKCQNDPLYFIENYCKIVSLDHGLVPFHTFEYQKRFLKSVHKNRFTIGKIGRQMGKTATTAAYVLWSILFNESYTVAIVANKASAAKEVLSRVKDMYELLPIWLQEGVERWNMFDIKLENGSKCFCAATTASGLRGKSVNMLVIDEMAIIPNTIAEEFFTATFPTISSGTTTKVIMISTPLGYNHFWRFWVGAEQGTNGFNLVKADWWENPNRTQAWADEQLKILGEVKFNQEVLCSFIGSSFTLVSGKCIAEFAPISPLHSDDHFRVYEKAIKDHLYILISDPSEGIGGDSSGMVVINVTEQPYRIVATYKSNLISPVALPETIYNIAKQYNDAYVLCEINKFEDVARNLHAELEYENLMMISQDKRGQIANGGWGSKTKNGIITTKPVKRIGCVTIKQLIENKKLLIQQTEVIEEVSTFIEKKGSYEADDGYHDDLMMTLVLFGWLTTQPIFKEMTTNAERKQLFRDPIEQMKEQLTPFGFIVDGTEDANGNNGGWVDVPIQF